MVLLLLLLLWCCYDAFSSPPLLTVRMYLLLLLLFPIKKLYSFHRCSPCFIAFVCYMLFIITTLPCLTVSPSVSLFIRFFTYFLLLLLPGLSLRRLCSLVNCCFISSFIVPLSVSLLHCLLLQVMFTCEAEANPPALRYRWELNDVAVIGDHTSHYLLSRVDRSSNGAKVACIVSNDIGTQRAEHTLSVQCKCHGWV